MGKKPQSTIKEYEAIFIYGSQEQSFQTGLEKTKSIFQEFNVDLLKEEDMGQKKLAYEIKKRRDGRYYLFKIKAEGDTINQMNKQIYMDEGILKHIFIKQDYVKPRKFKSR